MKARLSVGLVWFAILASSPLTATGFPAGDHLVPAPDITEAQSPEAAYDKLWRQKLLVTPGEIARSVHLPGNVGVETAMSLDRKTVARRVEYWVTATQSSSSLWGCVAQDADHQITPESIGVTRIEARLPSRTALLVQNAWLAMLRQIRKPPPSEEIVLDSSTEIFSATDTDGKLLTGQFEGVGQGNAAALSDLANLLLRYCDSPAGERDDIAHKIDKDAGNLLSRVASNSGDVRNPKKARNRKQRWNVAGKVVPKVATLALVSNATEEQGAVAGSGSAGFTPVRILGKEGMIVPEVYLRESGLPAEGFWTPKTSQLKEVERSLPTFLRKEMQARPLGELSEVIALAPKYRRQYVGMILNGRKVIWVNCIPQKSEKGIDPFANWNREIIEVSDGGCGFWGAIYDVEKHSFERLILNGSA